MKFDVIPLSTETVKVKVDLGGSIFETTTTRFTKESSNALLYRLKPCLRKTKDKNNPELVTWKHVINCVDEFGKPSLWFLDSSKFGSVDKSILVCDYKLLYVCAKGIILSNYPITSVIDREGSDFDFKIEGNTAVFTLPPKAQTQP
jgi:hypothetical protein